MTEEIDTDLFDKIFAHIQELNNKFNFSDDISKISFTRFFDCYNSYKKDITNEQKCELFIPFVKYIKDNGILIDIPSDYNDIFSFFYKIYIIKSQKYYYYFVRVFMSKYITLYTPKYFYDNLEKDILSEPYLKIFDYKKFLIIIKAFIDYKYISINLIIPNIHKYITYLKLIKTDTEKALIMKHKHMNIFSIEKKEQIYCNYITDIEAITNELYFACSYRYLWIGAVIRGIFL